jgi:drug/metabolite transporter (DMT)-like permease
MYSLGGIASKTAATQQFLSFGFFFYYGLVLLILFVYAILWQQILKKMPLTTAFSNKSITVILGMLWGALFFQEQITLKMIIGAAIIMFGIYLVVTDHE